MFFLFLARADYSGIGDRVWEEPVFVDLYKYFSFF